MLFEASALDEGADAGRLLRATGREARSARGAREVPKARGGRHARGCHIVGARHCDEMKRKAEDRLTEAHFFHPFHQAAAH